MFLRSSPETWELGAEQCSDLGVIWAAALTRSVPRKASAV